MEKTRTRTDAEFFERSLNAARRRWDRRTPAVFSGDKKQGGVAVPRAQQGRDQHSMPKRRVADAQVDVHLRGRAGCFV
jgi:hypothetical protein